MAECKAFGCTNNKRRNKGKHFFLVPKPSNAERRTLVKKWLHNLGTGHTLKTFPFTSNSVVCEDHFETACFAEDKVNKLLGLPQKKRLHSDAVPTIFVHRRPKTDTGRTERLEQRNARKPVLNEKHLGRFVSPQNTTSTTTAAIPSTSHMSKSSMIGKPHVKTFHDAQCQTDPVTIFPSGQQIVVMEPGTIVTMTKPADPETVSHDHAYAVQETASLATSTPVKRQPTDLSGVRSLSPIPGETETSEHPDEATPKDQVDRSWHAPSDSDSDQSDCDLSFHDWDLDRYTSLACDSKFIVFEENLTNLVEMTRCPKCGAPVCTMEKSVSGTCVSYNVQYLCNDPHISWSAQPHLRSGRSKVPAGNIIACASTLYTGLTFSRIQSFCDVFNLSMVSESTFYDVQSSLLIPVVGEAWHQEQELMKVQLKEDGSPLTLAGDGRCDSPGFCAKYCTYSLLDTATEKIVNYELVQVTQTGTSQAMEKYGFCKTVDGLLEEGVSIGTLVTDRHVGIRSVMRKHYSHINHQFDVYHIANNIRKKLTELARLKKHATLAPWMKSVQNHIWFSSRQCDGNPEKLVELFTSIIYHVAGKHSWSGNQYVNCCLHGPLDPDKQAGKLWLKGATLQALKDIIFNPTLLRDIRQISLFCHTGRLESYHSNLLVYCPKRQEFDFACMQARTELAILHHNANVGRKQATVKKPTEKSMSEGSARYKMAWKKQTASWVARPAYEASSTDHLQALVLRVLQVADKGIDVSAYKPSKPTAKNIAKKEAPEKSWLISRHKSRF